MYVFGLIGKGLKHSFSANYFNQKFENENINAKYYLFEIDDISDFDNIINKTKYLVGLNVTSPYKEMILQHVNNIAPEAKVIKAINTITVEKVNNEITTYGYNTDKMAFKASLNNFCQNIKKNVLILGTGGAAKAVAYALDEIKCKYKFVSRYKQHNCLTYDELNENIINSIQLIINATPLGMFPHIDTFPPIPYKFLNNSHYLYDLIYNPGETQFLKNGNIYGAKTKNGLEMLHLQAEFSWNIWKKAF